MSAVGTLADVLINEQTISSMENNAILIATARDMVVDLNAITAALNSHRMQIGTAQMALMTLVRRQPKQL